MISRVKDMSEWKKWSIKWFITVIVFIIVSFLLLVRIAKWTGFELADWPSIMILIEVMVGVAIYAGIASRKTDASEKMKRQAIWACSIFVLVLAGLLILHIIDLIRVGEIIEIIVLFGLVLITAEYARHTRIMAKEMREQRIIASRPYIIQRAIYKHPYRSIGGNEEDIFEPKYFNHFEIYNAGKSPAIELEIFLTEESEAPFYQTREPFFLTADEPQKFYPDMTKFGKSTKYKLVCQYQSIFSHGPQKTVYQTLLPFELVESGKEKEGKIFVKTSELEFRDEVPWEKRILLVGDK